MAFQPDPTYLATMTALGKNKTTTLTGLTGERQRGLQSYGYTETNIDPKTGIGTPVFDPSNPFSKAALLKANYTRQRAGTAQRIGSTGGLYSGAAGSAQRFLGRQQLGAEDQLTRSLIDFLGQNTQQANDASYAYEQGAAQALGEATQRARDNALYEPTPDATPAAAKPAGGKVGLAQAYAANPQKPFAIHGPRGEPPVWVNGKPYYRRTSDNKMIPLS